MLLSVTFKAQKKNQLIQFLRSMTNTFWTLCPRKRPSNFLTSHTARQSYSHSLSVSQSVTQSESRTVDSHTVSRLYSDTLTQSVRHTVSQSVSQSVSQVSNLTSFYMSSLRLLSDNPIETIEPEAFTVGIESLRM